MKILHFIKDVYCICFVSCGNFKFTSVTWHWIFTTKSFTLFFQPSKIIASEKQKWQSESDMKTQDRCITNETKPKEWVGSWGKAQMLSLASSELRKQQRRPEERETIMDWVNNRDPSSFQAILKRVSRTTCGIEGQLVQLAAGTFVKEDYTNFSRNLNVTVCLYFEWITVRCTTQIQLTSSIQKRLFA